MSEVVVAPSQMPEPNGWQKMNDASHHIINPGNLIDYACLAIAYVAAPHFDKWPGIIGGVVAYGGDGVDGWASRRWGTVTKFGAGLDAVGDKAKLAWGFYHIWKNDQAPKTLLAAVAVPNAINAVMTVADRTLNSKPHFEVGQNGKDFMKYTVPAVGMNVIGTKLVAEERPILGRAIKVGATAVGFYGLKYGKASSREYTDAVKNGRRRPWIKKVIALASLPESAISLSA